MAGCIKGSCLHFEDYDLMSPKFKKKMYCAEYNYWKINVIQTQVNFIRLSFKFRFGICSIPQKTCQKNLEFISGIYDLQKVHKFICATVLVWKKNLSFKNRQTVILPTLLYNSVLFPYSVLGITHTHAYVTPLKPIVSLQDSCMKTCDVLLTILIPFWAKNTGLRNPDMKKL